MSESHIIRNKGKVWEFTEIAAFSFVGTLYMKGAYGQNLLEGLGYTTLLFLAGKTSYLITKKLAQKYYPERKDQAGWGVSFFVVTGAGYLFQNTKMPTTFLWALFNSTVCVLGGVGVRKLAYPLVKKLAV